MGDVEGALRRLRSLPYGSGKAGVIGTCSGGQHTFLVACRIEGFDAAVDCWGGRVVMSQEELNPNQPVAPIDYTRDLSCPLLGLFGEEDRSPTPEQVAQHEQELKRHDKTFEFHMYPNAGHGFFYYDRPFYRQEQAVDGWGKVFASSKSTSVNQPDAQFPRRDRQEVMCTMIVENVEISGCGKGPHGWFTLTQAGVSYDHPFHAPLDHALNIDFVNEAEGVGARVAVELAPEAARRLVEVVLAVLERGSQFHPALAAEREV